MNIGDYVKVMYPYDVLWWETEAVIIDKIEDKFFVLSRHGKNVWIDLSYLETT